MQASKKIPFEDPTVLNAIRGLYILSNLIIAGLYFYMQTKMNAKKGALRAPKQNMASYMCHFSTLGSTCSLPLLRHWADMTTLKYVEPAPMGTTDEPKLVTTTIYAYDTSKLKEAFRGQLMGVAMMGVMHVYFKYTNPLLIQVCAISRPL